MVNYKELTVGEIVKNDYRKADVFKKYKIDFCCKGKLPLTEACDNRKVDFSEIEKALVDVDGSENQSTNDFTTWEIDKLADYIVEKHHKYVAEAIPAILEYTNKVAKVHGDRLPYVIDINNNFIAIAQELEQHMQKEEMVLFPFVKQITEAKRNRTPLAPAMFGTVQNPINMMEMEHEKAGEVMFMIKELTDNYTPPADACMTHQVSYHKLKEFENDLFDHIHLENNILFPKAIQYEKELLS